MIRNLRERGIFIFILAALLTGSAAAQTASTTDIVYVTATVNGPKKAPAPGLTQANFQLYEDGVEQKIVFFSPSDGIWDIDIILANSSLLPGKAGRESNAVRDAVETFKKTSNGLDKIKVEELNFGSDGLYAAIDRNLLDLQKTTNARKALLVITDGFDTPGGDAASGLIEYSRKLNIPIYFFYSVTHDADTTANETGARGTKYSDLDAEAFTTVAEQSGGGIFFGSVLNQLETQCKLLAQDLKNKYVLGFKSTNDAKDDKWRKLKVTLKSPPAGQKLEISAKPRYFVPKPLK